MAKSSEWRFVEETLNELMKTNDDLLEAGQAIGLMPESIFNSAADKTGESLIKALEILVGDSFSSIEWYVIECDYGRLPKEAGIEDDMRLIDSVEMLRWLVELKK